MTRELFVSSTPHETKVGMVEDDLLAEIYLERENEYTLAGSIYKGRVTRVLPGMQSAFVDIGLERDAFLYVSDFMELEDSEDLDEVPTNRPVQERYQQQPQAEAQPGETVAAPVAEAQPQEHSEAEAENHEPLASGESRDNRGGFRGRRRRRGRRGERSRNRGSRVRPPRRRGRLLALSARIERSVRTRTATSFPERAVRTERPARTDRPERSEYGPPPGYQPIILPGESISKYRHAAHDPACACRWNGSPLRFKSRPLRRSRRSLPTMNRYSLPLRASAPPAESQPQTREEASVQSHVAPMDDASSAWDREQQRLHQMNVAAVFGGEVAEEDE